MRAYVIIPDDGGGFGVVGDGTVEGDDGGDRGTGAGLGALDGTALQFCIPVTSPFLEP